MRHTIRILFIAAAVLGCACEKCTCDGGPSGGSDRGAPPDIKRVTGAVQAAAMDLGFATGSMLAQVPEAIPLRKQSFAKFERADADLRRFAKAVGITSGDADVAVAAIRKGFDNPDPIPAGQGLLKGMNLLKDRLGASDRPELMHVMRVGFVIGHTTETAAWAARNNPTPENLRLYVSVTERYRGSLADDLARAQLPAELADAVRRTSVEVRSADDLQAVIRACLRVKDLVDKMESSG